MVGEVLDVNWFSIIVIVSFNFIGFFIIWVFGNMYGCSFFIKYMKVGYDIW